MKLKVGNDDKERLAKRAEPYAQKAPEGQDYLSESIKAVQQLTDNLASVLYVTETKGGKASRKPIADVMSDGVQILHEDLKSARNGSQEVKEAIQQAKQQADLAAQRSEYVIQSLDVMQKQIDDIARKGVRVQYIKKSAPAEETAPKRMPEPQQRAQEEPSKNMITKNMWIAITFLVGFILGAVFYKYAVPMDQAQQPPMEQVEG